ncbi:MAG: hypothetical protein OEW49_06545 [Nitrosopumilus sp.]|nr:hypothetical protein [Nitrosopumilus sp.]
MSTPIYKRPWGRLTPRQKLAREKSLAVLKVMRNSKNSLHVIARQNNIQVKTLKSHTNGFKKVNGVLVAKKWDAIPRVMLINEDGKTMSIEIKHSRTAGVIGRYHNAVKYFLNSGDKSKLNKFRNKKIKDSSGKIHRLETDAEKIMKINQKIEEPEFYEVYSR